MITLFTKLSRLLFFFSLVCSPAVPAPPPSPTSLSCSTTQNGKAVINEVNASDNFVEIYLLQSTDILDWAIYLDDVPIQSLGHGNCTINGQVTLDNTGTGANGTTFPTGTFIVCTANINPSKNEVLLVDKSGTPSGATVIDYLGYGNLTPQALSLWSVPSECGTLYPGHNSSNKDIARIPDGSGPLEDNGNNSTPGSPNDGGGGGGGDTAATNFNCVENGADGISGTLYTKTTAQSFSFDIVALQDASTIETNFASGADHTVTVELVDAGTGDGTCANYSALTPSVSQSLTITSSDSGTKASAAIISNTAYSAVKCRVSDATDSPSVVGCSTDSFTIRPTAFTVTSNLTNITATGTPKAKAGETFTLTSTATTGYTGTPAIDNSKIEAHTGAVQTGSISGAFNAANSGTGVATGTSFTYSEVGSLRFAAQGIYDDTFTAVDQSSDCTDNFSNSPVGGKIGCKFGNTSASDYFGRFTPDHLDVTLNTPVFNPGCSTFSYLGQPVRYATQPIATVTAKNSAGTTTQNYTGNFWKIDPTDAVYGITPSYSEASYPLLVLESGSPSVSDNGNGTGFLTFADTSITIH